MSIAREIAQTASRQLLKNSTALVAGASLAGLRAHGLRLGRGFHWDRKVEQMIGGADANAWQPRDQGKGFEIVV